MFPGILVVLCIFSSLWWPFGWNWSYLGFLGIIWRMCASKCRGEEGGGIFPMLCVEFCLVLTAFIEPMHFNKTNIFTHARYNILVSPSLGSPQSILSSADLAEDITEVKVTHTLVHGTAKSSTPAGDGGLVELEEQETGSVKLDVYRAYWIAVGRCLAPSVLVALFLMQGQWVWTWHDHEISWGAFQHY